jgi:hypothetical protein
VVIKMNDVSYEYLDWMYKVTHIKKNNESRWFENVIMQ